MTGRSMVQSQRYEKMQESTNWEHISTHGWPITVLKCSIFHAISFHLEVIHNTKVPTLKWTMMHYNLFNFCMNSYESFIKKLGIRCTTACFAVKCYEHTDNPNRNNKSGPPRSVTKHTHIRPPTREPKRKKKTPPLEEAQEKKEKER